MTYTKKNLCDHAMDD